MSGKFDFAAGMFRDANTAQDRRVACRIWLTDAIQWAHDNGENVAPAMALLSALEGLEFGHVDAMLRLPDGQKAGGKEPPPAETGFYAMALAAVDRLLELGVSDALNLVAGDLAIKAGALASKRKHVMSERAKPPTSRQRYVALIEDYERERERMAGQTGPEILLGLSNVAKLLGRK
ncbi:hypothetical protein [Nitrobacter sp. TKz-YC02]|uniref:hypothetical protein n=1 Tax=Nitrobacter sp. TKz-YC02 TaxID=3398704 RepID=UPI003CFA63D3